MALMLVLLVSGCRTAEPQTPEETGEMPYGKWGFAFFTPHALPAVVTYAALIDSGNVVSKFRTLDSTQSDPGVVGSWQDNTNSGSIHFNKARHVHRCIEVVRHTVLLVYPPSNVFINPSLYFIN